MSLLLSLLIFFSCSYAVEEKLNLKEYNNKVLIEKEIDRFFTAIRFSNNSLAMSYIKQEDLLKKQKIKIKDFLQCLKKNKKMIRKLI